MIKKIIFTLSFFCLQSLVFAQKKELFDVNYEIQGESVKTLGFIIPRSNTATINKVWNQWIKSKGGKTTILRKNEATNVKFRNSSEIYNVYQGFIEQGMGSVAVINVFQNEKGTYLSKESIDYNEIYERLLDMAYEMRKASAHNEIKEANKGLIQLDKHLISVQKRKNNAEHTILKNNREILKLEYKIKNTSETIVTLENTISTSENADKKLKLVERKIKQEKREQSLIDNVQRLKEQIVSKESEIKKENIDLEITEAKIKAQNELVKIANNNFSNIRR